MPKRHYDLGTAELEVLKVLWEHGRCTVRQVLACLHEMGRGVKYTTVLTFLTRLEQKGYVTSDKRGMAYVYRATLSRERVTRSRLKTLVQQLYDGAAAPMVLQLMRTQSFSPDEIAALHALIDELDTKAKRQVD